MKTPDSSTATYIPIELSPPEMQYGQRLVRRFATLNGISVALLLNSMLILYAIKNGVGDAGVAVLASFIHLTMPLMLVGKGVTARFGAARTWGMGWLLRNVCVLVIISAPFVPSDAPQWTRSALILLGGFGFAAFRAIGLVGNSPVIGEITIDAERGRFLSGNWVRATITQFLALVGVILILRSAPEMWVFQMVIALGASIGIYVGLMLMRVPETDSPRRSAQKPITEVVRIVWKTLRLRRLLFAWAGSFAAFTMVIPFALITLKNGYGLSDYHALQFTLLTLAGGTSASVVNRAIADRVGPRPLLIIYVAILGGIALFWGFTPDQFYAVPTAIAFFAAGYSKFGILVVTNHYFLTVSDSSDRVGSALILRVISGATAGLIGGFIGGSILELLGNLGLTGIGIYRTYFRIAALFFIGIVPIVVRLDRLTEWPISQVVGLILRPWRIVRLRREPRPPIA